MKKKALITILLVLALYGGFLAYEALSFRIYGEDVSPGVKKDATEIEGVYHVHSKFSDGSASVDEIARLASKEKLDFLVLTDHGSPNIKSFQSQGWNNGVLVLAGAELSVNRGHLVALGFRRPDKMFSRTVEEAVSEINTLGGFTVIAHPYSKVKWTWGDAAVHSGLEIINADTMFKDNIGRVLVYLPLLIVQSRLPLLKMLERPEINFKKWDQHNAKSPMFGFFSADAHLYYKAIFSLLHLHVLLDKPLGQDAAAAETQVYTALRNGRFYNAIEAVAGARGFRFEAQIERRIYKMGDTVPASPDLFFKIKAPFSFAKEIRLIHDGRIIISSRENFLRARTDGEGVYRVEVFLRERTPLAGDIPWIVSNPIYLGKDQNR